MSREKFLELKDKLLSGVSQVEDIVVHGNDYRIRPLTIAEKSKVQAMQVKGLKADADGKTGETPDMSMNMDMEQMVLNEVEATIYIVACGLSVPPLHVKPQEIKALPINSKVLELLKMKINELSAVEEDSALEQFRGIRNRGGIVSNGDDGVEAE